MFAGARVSGVCASSANSVRADLSGVLWSGVGATFDHAQFGGASLAGSLLVGADIGQAVLTGTGSTGAILCQAKRQGRVITAGGDADPTRFRQPHLEGATFDATTILSAAFCRASIAHLDGVPPLTLPLSVAPDLTDAGLHRWPRRSPMPVASSAPTPPSRR